jgi:hypothetical protein
VANIKIRDLEPESLQALGLPDPNADNDASAKDEPPALAQANHLLGSLALRQLPPELDAALRAAPANLRLDPTVVLAVLAISLAVYLFFCYCAMLICKKTGHAPGVLVWLPVLQLFPLLRAAGMSGWWFLAFFVPLLNIVAQILWCVNIIKARGKSLWLIVLFLLPLTNLIAFSYLAFSGTGSAPADRRFAETPPPLPA